MVRATLLLTYKLARRIVIAVIGTTVVLIGVAMIVLPGPAVIVIPLGLGILSVEFAWARHWLDAIKRKANAFYGLNQREKPHSPPRPIQISKSKPQALYTMMTRSLWNSLMTVPNMISSFRFVAAPALLWLAWHDYYKIYIAVLCLSFLSDAVDGYIARKLKQESQLGTLLDTWADIVIYITLPISAWWLWPEIMHEEAPFVSAVIISYTLPALIGMLKFGVLTTYHTWSVKAAVAFMGSTSVLMFAGGPTWPFRLATLICILAALENIAITVVLPDLRSNVRSLWHVLREVRSST
jgi:cardiolipin synthase (CMP-forming)